MLLFSLSCHYLLLLFSPSCHALLAQARPTMQRILLVYCGLSSVYLISPLLGAVKFVSYKLCWSCSGLHTVPPTVNELVNLSGAARALPFPSHVQCYWKTPKALGYFMDLVIFIFLGLSGSSAVLCLALPT